MLRKLKFFNVLNLLILSFTLTSCDLSVQFSQRSKEDYGNETRVSSNLVKTSFSNLPNWNKDDLRYAMQAFRNSCKAKIQYSGKVVPNRKLFEQKCNNLPSPNSNNKIVREWFERNFDVYKVYDNSGNSKGKFTGYYSPIIPACKTQTYSCNEPIMGLPTDGRNFKGVPKRTIVNNRIGKILYWANLVDVQNIQIQGSGMLRLEDGTLVKLNFAGVNDMPFKSIGEQLKAKGIRPDGGYSADSVWTYLKSRPSLAKEVIYNNQRYIYFYVSVPPEVIGKLGTPLSKIRSIAVDDSIYTLGLPMYINTNLSDGSKFSRLVMAQDTGNAIKGWIRADIFFGTGDKAYRIAHGQHSDGEIYVLIPR